MAKKNKKVIRYRKPLNLNIGMLIFAVMFVYMIFSVYKYVTKVKIQPYEVTEGSIVNDRDYAGVILRSEMTQYADRSGYINYYIGEGKRAAVGTSVCSIDESGVLAEFLASQDDDTSALSQEALNDIKKQLYAFDVNYRDEKFDAVYDVRYALDAVVMEHMNFSALGNQEELVAQLGESFHQNYAPVSGVVSYGVDAYEELTPAMVSAATFDRSQYNRAITQAGKLVEQGSPIYKIITDDSWSLVFPMTEEDVAAFGQETSLKVSFPGHNLTAAGEFSMITGSDGAPYGQLDFDRYMVQFVSERFLDFEILTEAAEGLKIPVSSVTEKDFFLVPADYLTEGGDSRKKGFQKEVYSESGTSIVFVPATIYYSTEEYCYIETDGSEEIHAGDYLVKPQSSDRYQIGPTAALQGVYNINRGYTVFKQIEILAENDEFYIIRKNMPYGLSVYDHIVLDAAAVGAEGVLIYQ